MANFAISMTKMIAARIDNLNHKVIGIQARDVDVAVKIKCNPSTVCDIQEIIYDWNNHMRDEHHSYCDASPCQHKITEVHTVCDKDCDNIITIKASIRHNC